MENPEITESETDEANITSADVDTDAVDDAPQDREEASADAAAEKAQADLATADATDPLALATRTQEVLAAVDLEAVLRNDPQAISTLSAVTLALEKLAEGENVEHVEGVDAGPIEISEADQHRADVLTLLTDIGLTEHLGRVLHQEGDAAQIMPLDIVPHHEGLPDFEVCLAPHTADEAGYHGLLINADEIIAVKIKEPVTQNHWKVIKHEPYAHLDALLNILTQYKHLQIDPPRTEEEEATAAEEDEAPAAEPDPDAA
ncbi:MAG: hypothetical protein AAF513_10370 [Pseudomonadota bacterium]